MLQIYIKKTYDMGWVKEVEKYYPGNYGAPGQKREPKKKRTPEDIAKQNQTIRENRIRRLIAANFGEGDWHLTLTYRKDERPESLEEAKGQLREFLKKMRQEYKRAGIPFKYIYVTERGKQGACHHHLIIEDISQGVNTKKLVLKYWKHGHQNFSPLYRDGEFEDLAKYIAKKQTKEESKGCTYSHSRNLIIPEPKKEVIHRTRWRKTPKPEKGFYITSCYNGENPATGRPYQHYTMRRSETCIT